jgi:hypothetical protein
MLLFGGNFAAMNSLRLGVEWGSNGMKASGFRTSTSMTWIFGARATFSTAGHAWTSNRRGAMNIGH